MGINRRTLLAATGALLGMNLLAPAKVEHTPNDGAPLKSAAGLETETFNLFDFEGFAQ